MPQMRSILRLGLVYLAVLSLFCHVQTAAAAHPLSGGTEADEAIAAFGTDSVLDVLRVDVRIGEPSHGYRLRLVFADGDLCGTQLPGALGTESERQQQLFGESALERSQFFLLGTRHRRSSATYVTLIEQQLGRDVVQLGRARWRANLVSADSVAACHDVVHALAVPYGLDGIYVVHYNAVLPGASAQHWRALTCTAQTLRYSTAPLLSSDTATLGNLVPCAHGNTSAAVQYLAAASGHGAHPYGEIVGGALHDARLYRVVVVPTSLALYVPLPLFHAYFADKNVYVDDPAQWAPLEFTLADGTVLAFAGETLLPLKSLTELNRPARSHRRLHDWDTGGIVVDRGGELRENGYVAVSADYAAVGAVGDATLSLSLAVPGPDTLKILPHTLDAETVVLGGHALWSNVNLAVDLRHGTASVRPATSGVPLTVGEFLLLFVFGCSYLRWKLAPAWFDATQHRDGRPQLYYAVITRSSFFWSVPLLVYAPLIVALRWTSTYAVATDHTCFWLVAGTGIAGYATQVALAGYFWRLLVRVAASQMRSYRRTPSTMLREMKQPTADTDEPQAPSDAPTPTVRAWEQTPAHAHHAWNRPYKWLPLALALLYTLSVDAGFLGATWLLFVGLSSHTFALTLEAIVLTLLAALSVYHALLAVYGAVWPLASAWRAQWKRRRRHLPHVYHAHHAVAAMAVTGTVLVAAAGVCVYVAAGCSIAGILRDFSPMYEDSAVAVLIALYVSMLVFTCALLARQAVVESFLQRRPRPTPQQHDEQRRTRRAAAAAAGFVGHGPHDATVRHTVLQQF